MIKNKSAFPILDKFFLEQRIEESSIIIKQAIQQTDKPLVIQFSGGRDSMVMLKLVQEVTDNFVCSYMQTGIDFPESVEFAKLSARNLNCDLLISTPKDHLGDFFERLASFRTFPTVRSTWCNRDLKVRPQQKMLNRIFGKGNITKLIGVRRSESSRRMSIYKWGNFTRPDNNVGGANNVYPILHWTDADILGFIEARKLSTSTLYKKYGVSGCYWCPFYQPSIYKKIIRDMPELYNEFVRWEEEIGPSVGNYIYLSDIIKQVQQESYAIQV